MPQPAPSPAAGEVHAMRLDESHASALAAFFQEIWQAPPPRLDPLAPAFGLFVGKRLAGYIGTIPVRFWDGAREEAGHWMKGFMVLPEYRNSGIGFLVLKEAVRQLGLAGSLSVAPAARRLFTALGFAELGALSNQITLLRPVHVARAIDSAALALPQRAASLMTLARRTGLAVAGGFVVAAALALWRFLARLDTLGFLLRTHRPEPGEIDRLWHRVRRSMPAGVVRDAAHFADYGPGYRFVTVHTRGSLRGMAVVRLPRRDGDPRLGGIRVAVIADIVVDGHDRAAQRALLRAAESAAQEAEADALLCSATFAPLQRLLAWQGYLPFPANVRLLLRGAPAWSARAAADWWLTRGDGHADEVF